MQLNGSCKRKEVQKRMLEKYGSPATTNRTVQRCFQTLIDWEFFIEPDGISTLKKIEVEDLGVAGWFLKSLLNNSTDRRMSLLNLAEYLKN